ncbi:hypothetical protein [Acinetobacter bereziniae]|nr:hypothetical protein [Acinetobacter bereziniae]
MSKNQAPLWLQRKTTVKQKLLEQSKASHRIAYVKRFKL